MELCESQSPVNCHRQYKDNTADALLFGMGTQYGLELMTSQGVGLRVWDTKRASMATFLLQPKDSEGAKCFCRGTVNAQGRAEKTCPGRCLGSQGVKQLSYREVIYYFSSFLFFYVRPLYVARLALNF